MERIILHSDLNSCYASIETMLDPSLKGRPVAVGGSAENRHGIILAKSREAKLAGVKTGEVIWQAREKCPSLIVIPPHFNEYMKYTEIVREIYRRYTDLIEPFGLDEAWLDVSGSTRIFGGGEKIAENIRRTVKYETGLTVSIGVSFNKVFAKIGSDLKKPDAVTVIDRPGFREKLWPLPASVMIGVGRATSQKLAKYGIYTLGELAGCEPEWLVKLLGKAGGELWIFANGLDVSRVKPDGFRPPVKSVGHGITCKADLVDATEVWRVFLQLSQSVNKSLHDYRLLATCVQICIRDCRLFCRLYQRKLAIPTQSATELAKAAIELFSENYSWSFDVRSVTIRATELIPDDSPVQTDLFTDIRAHERREKIDSAVLDIRRRFGNNSIFNACLMEEKKIPHSGTLEKAVMPSVMFK